jgi:hypothetical protein
MQKQATKWTPIRMKIMPHERRIQKYHGEQRFLLLLTTSLDFLVSRLKVIKDFLLERQDRQLLPDLRQYIHIRKSMTLAENKRSAV